MLNIDDMYKNQLNEVRRFNAVEKVDFFSPNFA